MLLSEVLGRRVMGIDQAHTIGLLSGLIVDAQAAKVFALRVAETEGAGTVVLWRDLTAFGSDAITVPSGEVIGEPKGRAITLSRRESDLLGKDVLTTAGVGLGPVKDIDFDQDTGSVLGLLTAEGPIVGGRLVGCGSYAVVVELG
jgi:sporulation protein YlmC with PRC-barrel domain